MEKSRGTAPRITYEISVIDDRRNGWVHFQEQADAAPGMAEGRQAQGGYVESFPHSAFCREPSCHSTAAASHDEEALPHRADARAAARLQSDLHGLRTYPRIRIHHHRARSARRMPGGGG